MVSFKGRHRTKFYTLKYKVLPRLQAMAEYFVGPLPA